MKMIRVVTPMAYHTWRRLRDLAEQRRDHSGRASVGEVVRRLVQEEIARREGHPPASR